MAVFYRANLFQSNSSRALAMSCSDRGPDSWTRRRVSFGLQSMLVESMALRSVMPLLPQDVKRGLRSQKSRALGDTLTVRCNTDPRPQDTRGGEGPKGSTSKRARDGYLSLKSISYNGIFLIILLNIGVFVADRWLRLPALQMLYLHHDLPRWYQFITSTFCHLSWNHLSSNLFFLYIFGKLVEEEGGSFAVWLSYIITGVGANLVSWLILPRSVVSAGSSGAVFGLFTVSVLVKLSFNWRKILEVLILGQFVVDKVMSAAVSSAQLGGRAYSSSVNINHIAHLSGALVGVALIWVLRCLPTGELEKK